MKLGQTKVPIERIPALARACRTDAREFIDIAMREYSPKTWEVLESYFPRVATLEEEKLMALVELADLKDDLVWDERLEDAMTAVLELARTRG
jgi:hypothetical protein